MYTINFFNSKGERYDFGQFFVMDNETFLDKLEEALYIMQELTPAQDSWKRHLCTTGMAFFTYHNLENVTVFFDWGEDCTINVMDRDI
jgi:hypothetical protein